MSPLPEEPPPPGGSTEQVRPHPESLRASDLHASGEVTAPKKDPFFYGGQAVIEGVMMRGRRHYAVAVRLPKTHEIVIDRGELTSPLYTHPFWKLPFARGLALLAEQL